MTVNISVSNEKNTGCDKIIENLKKCNIDCRLIETNSLVDNKIEKGCLITLGEKWNNKLNLKSFWDIIKKDYTCAHLDIPGKFNGCILDYLSYSKCPGDIITDYKVLDNDKYNTLLTIYATP